MENWPLLSLVTFLPMAGVFAIMILRGAPEDVARNARWIALWTSLIDLALSVLIWARFDPTTSDFQFVEQAEWLPQFHIAYIARATAAGQFALPAADAVDMYAPAVHARTAMNRAVIAP